MAVLRAPVPWLPLAAIVALAWFGSLLAPLLVYTTTLAVFGLAHVAEELRYLHHRFGRWLAPVTLGLGGALSVVMLTRTLRWLEWMPAGVGYVVELAAAVAVLWVPVGWWWRSRGASAVAVALSVGLLGGLLWAPIPTLLAVAVLHNLTPVPLLAEALPATARPRFAVGALLVFLALPALLATGLPWGWVEGLAWPEARLLPSGSLAANYTAYLPVAWARQDGAQHWFTAIVFTQCLHYTAVLGALPRWSPVPSRGWVAGLLAATGLLWLGYAVDFREARELYGIVASVHAWIEVPILVLLLLPSRAPNQAG